MEEKIDFVITWVDSSDKKWQADKEKYSPTKDNDNRNIRYRDYNLLKYWFRGVEQFAPWVNKIYFVTYGHIPNWLNTDNEKIVIVNHKDFIPSQILPVFNSVPIELYLSKIKGLSENFVYFNDDMFIIKKTKPSDFFYRNLPRDEAILTANIPSKSKDGFAHCLLSNIEIVNERYEMKKVIKHNINKWFNYRYGLEQLRTLLLLPWNNFSGIKISHLPISYNKKTFDCVWQYAEDSIIEASKDRFRNNYHINHWIFRNHQLIEGNFFPRSHKFGKLYSLYDEIEVITSAIKKQNYKCICINDTGSIDNFENKLKELNIAFEDILPNKSMFEK